MKKEAQVIMLSTEERTQVLVNTYRTSTMPSVLTSQDTRGLYSDNTNKELEDRGYKPQHLYFTTDEEIKEGDWYIDDIDRVRKSLISNKNYWEARSDYKKIIATTDTKLTINISKMLGVTRELPQPSKAFIEKYCREGGIDEVDVEYQSIYNPNEFDNYEDSVLYNKSIDIPKIDSHNTITIYPIKNSWSREEVENLLVKYAREEHAGFSTKKESNQFNIWIKENL